MVYIPKRNKSKDNPYTLSYDDERNVYVVHFVDNKKILHSIDISEEVYKIMDKFELEDIKFMHEYERHIEHFDLDENNIYRRIRANNNSVEDIVERKLLNEELKKAINELSDIQKKRVIKYYFENKTLEEIADEENCSKVAVKYSIDIALEKISKKFKF